MREEICTPALDRVDELVLQGAHGDIWPLRDIEDLMRQAPFWTTRLLHLQPRDSFGTPQTVPSNLRNRTLRHGNMQDQSDLMPRQDSSGLG